MNSYGVSSATRCAGFTMVEALVAFVVLAAGLLALLSFHGAAQKANSDAKIQAEAVALAEDKLQELESFLTAADPRLDAGEGSDSPPGQLVTYARSWDVADDGTTPNLTIAEVTVGWTDREGDAQEVVISSAINRREPWASAVNFLKVAANEASAGGSGGGTWGDSPGGENPGGPGDPGNPTNPGNPQNPPVSEPQVTYTLTISGTTQTNLGDVELSNAADLIQVA